MSNKKYFKTIFQKNISKQFFKKIFQNNFSKKYFKTIFQKNALNKALIFMFILRIQTNQKHTK
jgi:hypothetical protein